MALSLSTDVHRVVLGIGAGSVSLLAGLAMLAIAASGGTGFFERTVVVAVLLVGALAYGVAGLYDMVALGTPKRGVAHLVTGAGLVLVLLAPYGSSPLLFAVTGGSTLVLSGTYHTALAADILQSSEEPADELEEAS